MSSDLKVTNIKHESSSSNNLVLASDGTTTVSGALTASGGIKVADGGNIGSASDTDAISISSAGYVIDSARPHFVADGGDSGTHTANADTRIPFSREVRDHGGNYSTTNKFFLTPVAGLYIFHTQIYTYQSGSNDYSFELRSENTSDGDVFIIGRIHAYSVPQGELLKTFGIAYLTANRRISVYNTSSGARDVYMGNQYHSVFHGCLIG